MPIDKQGATRHLDELLKLHAKLEHYSTHADRNHVLVGLFAALRRLAPPGSEYQNALDRASRLEEGYESHQIEILAGAAMALRNDYAKDRLQTFRELFNAEVLSDFLTMAEYLLEDQGLKDPAAVMAGGVLEQHIRKLCDKHGIATASTDSRGKLIPRKVAAMNEDLRQKHVYGKIEWRQITAWYDIRSSAAHAKYSAYDADQVRNMIDGVQGFVSKHPA